MLGWRSRLIACYRSCLPCWQRTHSREHRCRSRHRLRSCRWHRTRPSITMKPARTTSPPPMHGWSMATSSRSPAITPPSASRTAPTGSMRRSAIRTIPRTEMAAGAAIRAQRPHRPLRDLSRWPRRARLGRRSPALQPAQHPLPASELLVDPAHRPARRPVGARPEPELDAGAPAPSIPRRLHRAVAATPSSASACITASCWRC